MTDALDLTGILFASHTRLNVFEECGKKYEYEYILKDRAKFEKDYFIIGSACHKCIEMYYLDATGTIESPIEYADTYWAEWLRYNQLGFLEDNDELNMQSYLLNDLKALHHDIAQVHLRASAAYKGADAIRKKGDNKKGSPNYWMNPVADNPAMTNDWKDAMQALDLDNRMAIVDDELRRKGPQWVGVSLSNCYSEVREILSKYRDPDCLQSVEFVEFPVSHRVRENGVVVDVINPVPLPGMPNVLMNGYIDLVGRMTPEWGGGIGIGDYKSSQKECSVAEVMYHEQLNKYAYEYEELSGECPTHLFINNLRFGTVTVAPYDRNIALEAIERYKLKTAASEDEKNYFKRDPFAFDSPCLSMTKDGKSVKEYCAHFTKCHPGAAKVLGIVLNPASASTKKPSNVPTILKDGF